MPLRVVIAAVFAAALAACGAGRPETGVVNVYTARHYDTDRAIYDAFTAKTGIVVRELPANADQLLERIRLEGADTQADLVIAADAGALWRMAEAGLLQPVDTPQLRAAVPERLRDPMQRWWSFSKRARVIVYRKGAIDPATISSYDDLASPALHGKVCVRSSTNTYNKSMMAARIARVGADAALAWARGVRANFARDPQGSDTDQLRAIAAGACSVALVNHYYLVRMAASADPADRAVADAIGLVFPDQNGDGAHVNVSGAGVAAYAQHRDNAVALLEFLLSPEAQAMLPAGNEEYPVRSGVPLTAELTALGAFKDETVSIDALGRHQEEAARLFEQAGWR
jgi:iron(III) transport system substrate-binding protein